MATDPALTEVYRSGPIYLVQRGGTGVIVDPDQDANGQPTLVGSILAHLHVFEPWEPTEDYGEMAERIEMAKAALVTDRDEGTGA